MRIIRVLGEIALSKDKIFNKCTGHEKSHLLLERNNNETYEEEGARISKKLKQLDLEKQCYAATAGAKCERGRGVCTVTKLVDQVIFKMHYGPNLIQVCNLLNIVKQSCNLIFTVLVEIGHSKNKVTVYLTVNTIAMSSRAHHAGTVFHLHVMFAGNIPSTCDKVPIDLCYLGHRTCYSFCE